MKILRWFKKTFCKKSHVPDFEAERLRQKIEAIKDSDAAFDDMAGSLSDW